MTRREARQKWIEGLRHGPYRQGVGYLHLLHGEGKERQEAFCCMGVACHILLPDEAQEFVSSIDAVSYLDELYQLPEVLKTALGLKKGSCDILGTANDTHKLTFDQIAFLLETGIFWDEESDEDEVIDDLLA
jgi:hypothetical protein